MFLKQMSVRLRTDDAGAALAAVIGLMSLTLILSTLIIASVVGGTGFTTSTRAGVQSQASADAGVAVATASLKAGTCAATGGIYKSAPGAVPEYSASIWVQSGGTWAQGCPSATTTNVKIVSDGDAKTDGLVGQSAGDQTSVEATFSTVVATATTTIVAAGPAVYAYSSQGFTGSGSLFAVDNSNPSIQVRTGDIACSGGSPITGDIVIQNGTLAVSGSCKITGNVWVSGKLTVNGGSGVSIGKNVIAGEIVMSSSGSIGGDAYSLGNISASSAEITGQVVAAGAFTGSSFKTTKSIWAGGNVSISSPNVTQNVISGGTLELKGGVVGGSVWSTGKTTLDQGAKVQNSYSSELAMPNGGVYGNVWATTSITTSWGYFINGDATSNNLTLNGGKIGGTARIYNTSSINGGESTGKLITKTKTGSGTFGQGITISNPVPVGAAAPTRPATPATPTVPTVPVWFDFKYIPSDWNGFTAKVISGNCTDTVLINAVASFAGTKGIIDARGCTNNMTLGGSGKATLTNDLVILAKNFAFDNGQFDTSGGTYRLWMITEDLTKDSQPTCPSGGGVTFSGGFKISSSINLMVYSPCQVNVTSALDFRGQLFSKNVVVDGAAIVRYVAVGLPGVDLSTGLTSTTTAPVTSTSWTLNTVRNLGG